MERMSNDVFDRRMKELLGGLEAPYTPEHWIAMSDRLDQLGAENDLEFDEQIGARLENLGPAAPPAHWAMMSQTLDHFDKISDEEFDQAIADRLNRVSPPYHPEYWEKMLARQVEYRRRIARFILLRTAEILLLILLWMNWPFSSQKDQVDNVPVPAVTMMENNRQASTQNSQSNAANFGNSNAASKQVAAGMTSSNQVQAKQSARTVIDRTPIAGNIPSDNIAPLSFVTKNVEFSQLDFDMDMESGTHGEAEVIIAGYQAEVAEQDLLRDLDRVPAGSLLEIDSRTTPVVYSEGSGEMEESLAATEIPKIKKAFDKSRISISPFISADFNAINSFPNIQQLDETRLNHLTLTPGAGLGIGFHNGPWSVNTGLAYAYRFYDPNITEQFGSIQGYQELNFNKVELHMLQLPIRLNYNVVEGMKYSFYISGGASLHYILSQQFEKPRRPISSLEKIDPTFQAVLDDEQYRSGNFIGRFNEVTYVTADFGVGIERKLNEDISVYIQPTYMRMFGAGVGPNFDVIHTLSLQLGLRM